MRTKNGKRIGPVPITLVAVFALAAFLSAGLLLAPNGAQTVEAQSADCEVTINAAGDTITLPESCDVLGNTARVDFTGDADGADDVTLSLLIGDPSGPITAYPNGTTWDSGASELQRGGSPTSSMRYRYRQIEIPKPTADPNTGIVEGSTVTVMARGTIHIWLGVESVTSLIAGTTGTTAAGAREVATGAEALEITFFGMPAIGKDSANDRNKIVDDFQQCTTTNADGTFDSTTTNAEGILSDCGAEGSTDTIDADDTDESRSIVQADNVATFANADVSVLDGGVGNITLIGTEDTSTIRATIKDAKNQLLEDVEVTFSATSSPANIESRTRSYDSDTSGQATHIIRDLQTSGAYRVTVVVTAEGLADPVGTIVIARAGDLETVAAEACAMVMTGETDTKMDGCMTGYNPKMVYGPGSMFSIYAKATDAFGTDASTNTFMVRPATAATWWDTLNCVERNDAVMPMGDEPPVGPDDATSPYCKMYAGLSAEAMPVVMRAFGDAYGDATEAFNITANGTNVPTVDDTANNTYKGMVPLTVEDDAPGAKYLLDVVAISRMGTNVITKSDQVMITVSGPLAMYEIDGPNRIQAGGVVTYTVYAQDELGNPAYYESGQSTMADVFVDANPSTIPVRLLDLSSGMLDLSGDSKDSFRLRVPPGTGHGSLTITVTDKNNDVPDAFKDVRIGANRAPMAGTAVADQMVKVGGMVTAPSNITDPDGDTLAYSVMSSDDMIATAMVDAMGMVTITGVGAGMATITVTATDPNGASEAQTIKVMVESANRAPMAGTAVADQMVKVGGMVTVPSNITDPDGDTLAYSVMSSDDMIATAMVDAMGMVTITGVGAGMATITVTATDAAGMSAHVEIDVTVEAAPPMAPTGGSVSVLRSSITVSWTPNSAQGTTLIKVALFNEGITDLANIAEPVRAFNLAAADPGAHTFSNVPSGMYRVVLAAVDSDGMHVTTVLPGTVTVN